MTTHEQEQRVETLVAAYLQAAENGENPDPDQLIHENPQFSSELTEFFRVCQEVDNLVHPSLVQEANCRLRGEPTMAHPAWAPRRACLWTRRNKGWVMAVAALMLALFAAFRFG